MMRFRNAVLGCLMICLVTPAAFGAECARVLDDEAPNQFGLLFFPFNWLNELNHLITVKSGGHVTEYRTESGDVEIYVDGDLERIVDLDTAKAEIDAACSYRQPAPGSPQRSVRSAALTQRPAAGQTNEDVVVADFNGDGVPDSAVLDGGGIFVTLSGKDGNPLSTASYHVADIGPSIVAADFNGDHILDLAVTRVGPSPGDGIPGDGYVLIFLGTGDGSFGPPTEFPAGPLASYLASGDFNGDGAADLAVTNLVTLGSGRIAVLLGNGDGSFAAAVNYPVGRGPLTLVSADFNHDGNLDLASLDAELSSAPGHENRVWVLLGNGDGTFQPAIPTIAGTGVGHLAYADLDHDGNLDLVIADQHTSSMAVMMGNGNGTFQAPNSYVISARPKSIAVLPLADGNTSLITADNASDLLFYFFVTSDGRVHSPRLQSIGARLAAVAAADLNGDHHADLVMTGDGNIYVKLASGNGEFADPVIYPVGSGPGALAIADVNGDGTPDVIAADTAGLDVLLGIGDGTLGPVKTFAAGGNLRSVTIADFNSDHHLDVAAANAASRGVSLFIGNGDGSFQAPQTLQLENGRVALATASGDVNGDNKPDLIVAFSPTDGSSNGGIAVLLGNGNGTFQQPAYLPLPGAIVTNGTTALAVGDLNHDGKLDIIAAIRGNVSNQLAILLGHGDGTFNAPLLTDTNTEPPMIVITDLDGDGNPDLLLADCCGLSEASFMFGNGDGSFRGEVQFPSGPDPAGIAVADFNGDGTPDVAIIGQTTVPDRGTLAIWFNASTGASAYATSAARRHFASDPSPRFHGPQP